MLVTLVISTTNISRLSPILILENANVSFSKIRKEPGRRDQGLYMGTWD